MATDIENFRLAAALEYAARGWHVMPIWWPFSPDKCACPLGKACTSIAKHPMTPHGLTEATTDEAQIRDWWANWPAANVAIRTGAISGVVALDEDPKNGGDETLAEQLKIHGDFPVTVRAITGSGGSHTLFGHPGELFPNSVTTPKSTGWLKLQGLDIRGDGGYIVASPSKHKSGNYYAWDDGQSPDDVVLEPVPAWIMNRLRMRGHKGESGGSSGGSGTDQGRYWLGQALAKAGPGSRNNECMNMMCQLRDNGFSQAEAEQLGKEYAERVPGAGYSEREAIATARSVYSRSPRQPSGKTQAKPVAFYVPPKREIKPVDTIEELKQFGVDVESGKIRNISFPWPRCTEVSQALLPGTITTVCGDPGAAKTYWVINCLMHWQKIGVDSAAFFIEKDRKFHTRRIVAALENDWNYKEIGWIETNRPLWEEAIERHREALAALGKNIWSEPDERVTLESLFSWVRQMASAGKRIITIDPITAAKAGSNRWEKDDDFVFAVQQVANAHGCSVVFVTHSAKGNRKGAPTGHDGAAGAAYYRFCDSYLWMVRTDDPVDVRFFGNMGESTGRFYQFFKWIKTREGKGQGKEIAFILGPGGVFSEQGTVKERITNSCAEAPEGESLMSQREADGAAKRLALTFPGQLNKVQVDNVSAVFQSMCGTVVDRIIQAEFQKNKRIDLQEFIRVCKENS